MKLLPLFQPECQDIIIIIHNNKAMQLRARKDKTIFKSLQKGIRTIIGYLLQFATELGDHIILSGKIFFWLFRPPFRWELFLEAFAFVGVGSLFIIILTGTFSGMIFSLQSIYGFHKFNAESLIGGVIGLSLTRELAPVFSALMVTSRAASAMATELGTMRVTEQIDALETMAVNPIQYLIVPRVIAGLIMVPFLSIVFCAVGMIGSYALSVYYMNIDPGIFMDKFKYWVNLRDANQGIIKAAVFGYITTLIACRKGFYAKGGAAGVGIATTQAVVTGSISIFIFDYILTSLMI